jgi:hypothetical protein
MIADVFMLLVIGLVLLALAVDLAAVAAVVGWVRRRWR